jgi:polyisoprenoid-binding protein YceI
MAPVVVEVLAEGDEVGEAGADRVADSEGGFVCTVGELSCSELEDHMKRALWLVVLVGLIGIVQKTNAQTTTAASGVPIYEITPVDSKIKFHVDASTTIEGDFSKWTATLTFTSSDVRSGVLDIKIQADSVDTGSGVKNGKLKGGDFFDVKANPYITFHSNKVVQTGPTTFDIPGTFTIRGVSKPETLKLNVTGKGTGSGSIEGTMAFDRKEYGMNSGIPFIKIADRVEVTVNLKGKRTSGPALVFQQ